MIPQPSFPQLAEVFGGLGGYWNGQDKTPGRESLLLAIQSLAGYLNQARKDAAERAEAQRQAHWNSLPQVFVRFGKVPEGGRSYNHHAGVFEAGLSVIEARELPDGTLWLAQTVGTAISLWTGTSGLLDRPAYLCQGEIVGRGGDGEPCLKLKGRARRIKGRTLQTPAGRVMAK